MAILAFAAFGAAPPPAGGQGVPGQLNTELHGQGVGSVRQSGMASLGNLPFNMSGLESDYRHDVFLSGRLRSEVRGEYLARGPLAPGGFQAYIPTSPMPFGPARPYGAGPTSVAPQPTFGRSAPAARSVATLPKPYTGVLQGVVTSNVGTLRPPAANRPIKGAPVSPPGVKAPLIGGSNYGVLRGH